MSMFDDSRMDVIQSTRSNYQNKLLHGHTLKCGWLVPCVQPFELVIADKLFEMERRRVKKLGSECLLVPKVSSGSGH
ncbi:hypothetical protein C5167_009789 [Papaver somniferum]|uniref:Uncharacterized protein n=1 Tax=Papaver somniferum TaxID=3469 RepID=A0A4Y7K1H7_PAPSO|nr:hypothetical protein C5167_009789 [Papaver somniferum]